LMIILVSALITPQVVIKIIVPTRIIELHQGQLIDT
jgi:hypothetical protein